MALEGKNLGPNFVARLLRILPWAEGQMGLGQIPQRRPTQILGVTIPTHWGKLESDLLYSDSTGVTVSIWKENPLADSGKDVEYVLPPPLLTSGQLDEGDWVKIEKIDGLWYVCGAPCA